MVKLDMPLIMKRFKELFGVNNMFLDKEMAAFYPGYHFDIIAFDDYAHKHWGYTEEEHGSLKDFVRLRFGAAAEEFIEFLINNRED